MYKFNNDFIEIPSPPQFHIFNNKFNINITYIFVTGPFIDIIVK